MKPTTKPIEIFKPGRHTAMAGKVLDYSDADLLGAAAAYDPAVYRAPLVVGHPKLADPSYGYVDKLEYADSRLKIVEGEVDVEFADVVDRKHYTNVSASFWLPDAPNNPKPGTLYLRHVGFLGATAPAIKGLKSVEFGEGDEEGIVTFADWGDRQIASLFRSLRDWIIGKHGLDEADKAVPAWAVSSVEEAALQPEDNPASITAFADATANTALENQVTPEKAAALEAENARLRAEADARAAADRLALADARHASHVSFADSLVGEARLAPKDKDAVVAALDHLATPVGDAIVEFGDGDDRKPLVDIVKDVLAAQPVQVEFAELATRERAADGDGGLVEFAAPDGMGVDSTRLAQHTKVLAYARANNVSYAAALAAVNL